LVNKRSNECLFTIEWRVDFPNANASPAKAVSGRIHVEYRTLDNFCLDFVSQTKRFTDHGSSSGPVFINADATSNPSSVRFKRLI
jgi:hypothetical protein